MSLLEKAKEIATAAAALAKLAAGGYDARQVPNSTYKERIALCKGCNKYNSLLNQCTACGCFLAIKARLEFDPVAQHKTGVKTKTTCPVGSWQN